MGENVKDNIYSNTVQETQEKKLNKRYIQT